MSNIISDHKMLISEIRARVSSFSGEHAEIKEQVASALGEMIKAGTIYDYAIMGNGTDRIELAVKPSEALEFIYIPIEVQ